MLLHELPEGRRFHVVGSPLRGRLIRLGPGSAVVRYDAYETRESGITRHLDAHVTTIAPNTVIEPAEEI